MPNCAVEYPFSFKVWASGALVFGRNELLPGADVAVSVMLPIPTEWWFRPVSKAWRVGAHNAVVGKRLKAQPTEHGGWRVAGDVGCTMKTMRSPVVTPGR